MLIKVYNKLILIVFMEEIMDVNIVELLKQINIVRIIEAKKTM